MTSPLKKMIPSGYSFGKPTFYGTRHRGQDYVARYVSLYSPCNGFVKYFRDSGGGKWSTIKDPYGYTWMFAHLSLRTRIGKVKEGQRIAITGNTGSFTTNPHLHLQIMSPKGVYVDPVKYMKGKI